MADTTALEEVSFFNIENFFKNIFHRVLKRYDLNQQTVWKPNFAWSFYRKFCIRIPVFYRVSLYKFEANRSWGLLVIIGHSNRHTTKDYYFINY